MTCWADIACNDPHTGTFTGRPAFVEFATGDMSLQLDAVEVDENFESLWRLDRWEDARGVHHLKLSFPDEQNPVVIQVPLQPPGWSYAVGNWCWDRFYMDREHARGLCEALLRHGWECSQWDDAHPFADLLDEAEAQHAQA